MYKNIERKQKIIDDKQRLLGEKRAKKEEKIKKRMSKGDMGGREINEDDIQNFESSMSWLDNS